MMYHFNVQGEDRKKLAKLIGETIGCEVRYMGVPSCAYQIGTYQLSKEGILTWNDLDDADPEHMDESCSLIQTLERAGFVSEEAKDIRAQEENVQENMELSISVSKSGLSETAFENLKALIQAKGKLMKKAFGCTELILQEDEEKISFPWFKTEGPDETQAYTRFAQAITKMAATQKRISGKEKEQTNEKYAFRCFLLRLGFIGSEYKKDRKILLKNFDGSGAFRTQEAADRAKKKQAEKKAGEKERTACLE